MSKLQNKAAKMAAESVISRSLGLPPGSTTAAKIAGKYAKKKAKERLKKYKPF